LGAGAAAGLAAGFNAPIAGVFALEVLGTTATSAVSVVPAGGSGSVSCSDWLGDTACFYSTRLRSPQSVGISFVYGIGFVCQFLLPIPSRSGSESLLRGVTVHLVESNTASCSSCDWRSLRRLVAVQWPPNLGYRL